MNVDIKKINFYTDQELFRGIITMRVNNKGTKKLNNSY